jgi:hypothetical protein
MRLAVLIPVMAILLPICVHAQTTGRIGGTVTDQQNHQLLEGATISVLSHSSGIFINHAVSNKKGQFLVTGLPSNQSLEVVISYMGYKDTAALLMLTVDQQSAAKNHLLQTGTWNMRRGSDDLDSVMVTFRKPPFVIRKDTLEFDARAFKSLPSDMLQDLLRKIPGMVVDGEGNVTVNGKKVNKIKVDGREFFNGNLKTAMENLPGSVIDKVQITDTRERGTEHNSIIQPIAQEVTLNLTLKKENKKGLFGHVGAGAGSSDRYTAGGFINALNGDNREAFFGNTGNASSGSGSMQNGPSGNMMMSSGSGILQNSSDLGFNLNKHLGKKGTIDLGYFTGSTRMNGHTLTDQTNILPDSTFQYTSDVQTKTDNRHHQLHGDYVHPIDSLSQLTISPNITYNDNTLNSSSSALSKTTNGSLINTQDNRSLTHDKIWSATNQLNYHQASPNRKTNLDINWSIDIRNSSGTLKNQSENIYYNTTAVPNQKLDQEGSTNGNGLSNNVSLNISRELGKHFTGIINYSFMQSVDNYDKDTYNFDASTGKHDLLDSIYSVHTRYTSITHLPTASIGFHSGKLTVEAGAGMRYIGQQNKIVWKDSVIHINQHNFSPRLTTAYQFARYVQWITNYTVNATAPTPDQLAPVPDNTNPLYLRLGNPYLHSSITHNIQTQLQSFTRDYKWHTSVMANSTISNNQIVDDTYYDSLGRQITTFRNTSSNYQVGAQLNAGTRIPINHVNINVDAGVSVNEQHSNGFINQQENSTNNHSIVPNINIGVQYLQYLSIQANASINFNTTHYSLTGINDVDYSTKQIMLFVRIMPVKRLVFISTAFYAYNSQLPEGFQKSRTLINAGLNYQFLKAEKLALGLSVNDLLNNNVQVTRMVSPTSIQNTQVDALKRYAMINLSYRFNRFTAGKG